MLNRAVSSAKGKIQKIPTFIKKGRQGKIAILGLFRSGTNYAKTLVEWNLSCTASGNVYGWKHGFFPIIASNSTVKMIPVPTLLVTKNPFSFLVSLHQYYLANGRNLVAESTWNQFLRKRIILLDSWQESSPQYSFSNPIELWNSMNWNHLSIESTGIPFLHLCYENLLVNPEPSVRKVAEQFQLRLKYKNPEDFKVPFQRVQNMGDNVLSDESQYVTSAEFNRSQYANQNYLKQFDRENVEFVLNSIDRELTEKLGYSEYTNKSWLLSRIDM